MNKHEFVFDADKQSVINNYEYAYSIAASGYKDLLGYEISDETKKLY